MHVLIAGGTGLIGRPLAARLAQEGHRVSVLSRRPQEVKDLPPGVRAEGWDGRTTQGWGPLVDGDTAIINLAGASIGEGRWTERRKRQLRDSRLDSTRALVEAALKARRSPQAFLQGSAIGYYGDRGATEVREAEPPGDDFLARLCVDWEAASERVGEVGVRRVVLRTGVVFTSAGGALAKMTLPFKFFAGGRLGSGRQVVSWIHRQDEVEAIVFLLARSQSAGAYNLSAPEPVTNEELTRALAEVLSRPALLPAPAFALRLALGEMAEMVLTGQRVLPSRLLEEGFSFRHPSLLPALRDLLA